MPDIHRRKTHTIYADAQRVMGLRVSIEVPPRRIQQKRPFSMFTIGKLGVALAAVVWLVVSLTLKLRPSLPTVASQLNTTTLVPDVEYHVIFSSGCSLKQDWQSYLFFYHAMISQQPGTITRIASGCTEENKEKLTQLFDEQIASMTSSPGRFRIHFAPDYSNQKEGANYKYWNKPFGTKHWMENVLGFPNHPQNKDALVILMDPDQVIQRPFRNNDFSSTKWIDLGPNQVPRVRVDHGKPVGQLYGFGLDWKRQAIIERILGGKSSPMSELTDNEALLGYIVGPPYIATASDMYKIATQWSEFAVPVYEQYPDLLAEMYAYCFAAAHLKLPHQTAISFMVSDVTVSEKEEDWGYIDSLPDLELCKPVNSGHLPNVFHYCQRYGLGTWMFGKHRLPSSFISCDQPLLKDPPYDVALHYNYTSWPDGSAQNWTRKAAKRNAFAMCHMIRAANSAAIYFKQKHCNNENANYNKSLVFP